MILADGDPMKFKKIYELSIDEYLSLLRLTEEKRVKKPKKDLDIGT